MALVRGFIHWVELDKRRPAVIVSPTRRNDLASDVIVVPCSSVLRPMVWHVRLERGEGGLSQASIDKCEQIVTLPKQAVSPAPLGPAALSPERLGEIERAIMLAVGIIPR